MSRGVSRKSTALLSFFAIIFLANGLIQGAIPANERAALIAIYNSSGGDSWTDHSGWKTPPLDGDGFAMPGTEGGWYGVTVTTDHVTGIDLESNNLDGTIPTDIGVLTALESLNMAGNALTGSLPTEIGNLTLLHNIHLGDNQLSGNIPASIGNLTSLEYLMLFTNQFSGDLPAEMASLTTLQWLFLAENQLSGSLPAWLGDLTALTSLQLQNNQFSGTIPTEIGSLANLTELHLEYNQLTGGIPTQLGSLTNLEQLFLHDNELTGGIPAEIGNLTSLVQLHLQFNQLSGSIPAQIGNLTNLQTLFFNDNELTGNIPAEIGSMTSLQTLGLLVNQLSGPIPSQIGNLSNLTYLHLGYNQLSGAIPTEIGNLTALTYLSLDQNQLSGSIPTTIGNLTNLTELILSENQLTGSIPTEMGNLTSLIQMNINMNQLSGSIPTQIGNLTNLTYLDLSINQLSSDIPTQLGNLTGLTCLDLEINQLSGPIPTEIGNLVNLTTLKLDGNQLTGSIPSQLGNLTNLQDLNLHENQLTGNIPTELGNLVNLTKLALRGNQLAGPIPTSLTNLTQLVPDDTDIGYNALYSEDAGLTTFLDGKDPDWANTQTIPPTDVTAAVAGATSVTVSWTPIPYTDDGGGYRVFHSSTPGGPYTFAVQTADKTVNSQLVGGLAAGETHYFVVQTRTDPHGQNNNTVDSGNSAEADTSTAALYISGYVTFNGNPLQGVVMNGLPEDPVTDAEGFYIAAVLPNWSGTVTPAYPGLSFSPPGRDYANVTASLTYQDYTAGDGTEPNDDPASAHELPLGTTENLVFAQGEADFYKFYVPPELAGLDLKVNVKVTSPYPDPIPDGWGSDIDFQLLDATPRLLGRVNSSSDDETLYLHNVNSGWYYVYVEYCTTEYADSSGYVHYAISLETGTAADFGIGYISGRVTDEGGTGVGDVFLLLDYISDDWNRCRPYMTTNPDGTFCIAFTPETYKLMFTRASKEWSAFQTPPNVVYELYDNAKQSADAQHLTLIAGQNQNLGDIELQTGAIVSGNVTDMSANPLAGVSIRAYDLEGRNSNCDYTRTDAAGNYSINGVPPGGAKIRIAISGFGVEFYDDKPSFGTGDILPTVAGETITGINAQLGEPGVIWGNVSDDLGNPIGGVMVYLFSSLDETYPRRTLQTGSLGGYYISNLVPGDYKVYFDTSGMEYQPEWYDNAGSFAAATTVTVTAGATTGNIDAQLDPRFLISGTVTCGGDPLEGVVMSGLPSDPVTDASGNYSGAVDPGWSGTVTPTLAGFTFDPVTRDYSSVGASQSNQNYTAAETAGEPNDDPAAATEIPLGTTGNLVFDYTGGDIDCYKFFVPPEAAGLDLKINARVIAPIPDPQHDEWWGDLDFELLDASLHCLGIAISSSGDETLYLHNVASGWYYVYVGICATWDNEREYDHAVYEITLETGTADDFNIGYISGRVTDEGATGVGDVLLMLDPLSSDWNIIRPYMTSNSDGTFCIAFTPGTYTLLFSNGSAIRSLFLTPPNVVGEYYDDTKSYSSAAHLAITTGQNQDLGDIELQTGAVVTGNVTDVSANPLADVAVYAYDLNGVQIGRSNTLSDAAGNYTLRGVPPGGAKIRFVKNTYGYEYYNDQVSFGTAETLATVTGETISGINAQLNAGGLIHGTVTDGSGNPVAGATVRLYSVLDETYPRWAIQTNDQGRYLLYNLKAGDYKVEFDTGGLGYTTEWYDNAGSFPDATPVTVTAGEHTYGIDAQLQSQFTISGTVSSGGTPLEGVTLTGLPGEPVTDAFGNYSAYVDLHWSGIVVPQKENYSFTPEQRIYNGVAADQAGHNYTADLAAAYTISGTVTAGGAPLEGVTMSGLPGNPVTDSSGNYNAAVFMGWSGTVTPALDGHTFIPDHRDYTNITADIPGQNYTAGDGKEPNDDPGSAAEIPLGTTQNLIFTAGEKDFYKFYVPPELAGLDLKVNVKVTSPYPDPIPDGWASDIDFQLLDATPRLLGRVNSRSDDETLYLHNVASGWYYVYVEYCTTEYADSSDYARYAITLETGTAADFGIGYISGRVTDEGGTGVGDVFLLLDYTTDDWNRCRPYMTSKPDGTFCIAFTPGEFTLIFSRTNEDWSAFHTPPNVVWERYNNVKTYADAEHLMLTAGQNQNLGDIELQTGAIVSGNVTDLSANPLAGAKIWMMDSAGRFDPKDSEYARADANGDYSINGVPPDGAIIAFTYPMYGTEYYNDHPSPGLADILPTVAGETITGINAQLGPAGYISGSVTDGSGNPIGGVQVRIFSELDESSPVVTIYSNNGGFYTPARIPGDYKIYVYTPQNVDFQSEWYENAGSFATATPVTVVAGEHTGGITIQLDPRYTISGTVTCGGEPLEGVVMSGLPGDPVTDASGNYSGAVDPGWSGTVTPTLAGFTFDPVSRDYSSVGASQSDQDYTAAETAGEPNDDPASATEIPLGVTEDLIFEQGEKDFYKFYVPPEQAGLDLKVNVKVTSPYPDPIPPGWRSDIDFELLDASLAVKGGVISGSDDETVYLHAAASGWYYIYICYCETEYADSSGYARYAITLETGTAADFGIGYISGRLVDEGGGGIANVYASMVPLPHDPDKSWPFITSGAGGDFVVAYPPGTYALLLTGQNIRVPSHSYYTPVNVVREYYNNQKTFGDAGQINVTSNQTVNVGDIELTQGAIVTGQVTDLSLTPLADAHVYMYDSQDNYQDNVYGFFAITDASGNYTLQGVPVDGAKLYFYKRGYEREYYEDKRTFGAADLLPTVAGGTLTGIDAQLCQGGYISGTVTDENGNGINHILVKIYSVLDETNLYTYAWTGSNGNYNLWTGTISPGDYRLLFQDVNGNYSSEWYDNASSFADATPVTIVAGEYTENIDAQLAATLTISGTVSSGGTPLEGVTLTGLPGEPVTDAFGHYSDYVDYHWSGIVVPVLENYTFTPEQRIYNSVAADQAAQDYTADLLPAFTISGTVTAYGAPLEGVAMQGLPGDPVTDSSGNYSAAVFMGWSGTVTPALDGYSFTPDHRDYSNITVETPGEDYAAESGGALPALERAALIALYNSTGGDTWTDNSGWKTPPLHGDGFALPGTEGSWYGVGVSGGHVTTITFPNVIVNGNYVQPNNLVGPLPPELGNLTQLTNLSLGGNHLSGNIPAEIGNLAQLQQLQLLDNQLSGSIPAELGSLSNLEFLELSENQLTGSIPSELGSLNNLLGLWLNDNQLSGSIPASLGNLSSVTHLGLADNQLSGSIPAELGNLTQMTGIIWLYNNQLTGSIPPELGNLVNLANLTLGANQLTGPIPPELAGMTSLQKLGMSGNQLSGPIPPELGNLANLELLYLSENQFTGNIPAELGNLTNLQLLYLYSNQLTGTIPDNLQNLVNLEYFNLSGNQLSGTLPSWLGDLSKLVILYLKNNQFTGGIPASLGNLSQLWYLNLRDNDLSGEIPRELGNLNALEYLALMGNQLTGEIPAELGNLSQLHYFWCSDNGLSGSIPASLGNLTHLVELWLNKNQLSGAMPAELGNLTNLEMLYLNANQLSGAIPAELGNLTSLSHLNLEANQLSGTIPTALTNMSSLNTMFTEIGYNALTATDPSLLTFLDYKDSDWQDTQTITPENVAAATVNNTSIQVTWDAIPYTADSGGYRIYLSTTPGGPYTFYNQTPDKTTTSMLVGGLAANTPHYFVVQTRTDPHALNGNTVDSGYSDEATAGTAPSSFTISGTITLDGNPLQGVVLAGLPGDPATDASGNYLAAVVYGWSGTVTPTLAGYAFTESATTYTDITADQVTDYTAAIKTYTISGTITSEGSPLEGVVMAGLPGDPATNAAGQYSATVDHGWSGTVTPTLAGYAFTPASTDYSAVADDQVGDYSAAMHLDGTDRAVLIALYNATAGDAWTDNSGWKAEPLHADGFALPGTEGSWFGIGVSSGHVTVISLATNNLSGTLPPALGDLVHLTQLNLHANHLSGALPPEMENLTVLTLLHLDCNQLCGIIPASLTGLTALADTNIAYNGLCCYDNDLETFLNQKDPDWADTQTVPPDGVAATATGPASIEVSWTPITYTADGGGYRVFYSETSSGPYTFFGQTADKTTASLEVTGLTAATTYYFVVRSRTDSHGEQLNTVDSEDSQEVFAATQSPAGLGVTSPNGGENWQAGTLHAITWTSDGPIENVHIEYSMDNGSAWTDVAATTPNDGTYEWTVPDTPSSQCLVRISDAADGSPVDESDAVFVISPAGEPEISLSRSQLNFGAESGTQTAVQDILVSNAGAGTLNWSAAVDQAWLACTPTSGTGTGRVTVSVDPTGLESGTYNGTVTVSDPAATNSPETVAVTFKVYAAGASEAPFGAFATPVNQSTVQSSISVSGWALDDVEVASVKIYREAGANLVFIGDAVFVEGARADLETSYPDYPLNYRGGWGYMLCTYGLPDQGMSATYVLHAIAADNEGNATDLGTKTIHCDNQNAVKPFGAIATPTQGGEAGGAAYRNWGWALTPPPNMIPTDGSTLRVLVDGAPVGQPIYNIYRADVAALFPECLNSDGAGAYFDLNTTAYANGVHTIAWIATDNAGNADGIGSRFFSIVNTSGGSAMVTPTNSAQATLDADILNDYMTAATPIRISRNGKDPRRGHMIFPKTDRGICVIAMNPISAISVDLNPECKPGVAFTGHLLVKEELRCLPIGTTMDVKNNIFYWQPAPGFLGDYDLLFVDWKNKLVRRIRVTIH